MSPGASGIDLIRASIIASLLAEALVIVMCSRPNFALNTSYVVRMADISEFLDDDGRDREAMLGYPFYISETSFAGIAPTMKLIWRIPSALLAREPSSTPITSHHLTGDLRFPI